MSTKLATSQYFRTVFILHKIREIKDLKQNWDSYGAPPIDDGAIAHAHQVLMAMDTDQPFAIVPMSSGGVQLEWTEDGYRFELSIEKA